MEIGQRQKKKVAAPQQRPAAIDCLQEGAKGTSAGHTSSVECQVVESLQEMMKLKRIPIK